MGFMRFMRGTLSSIPQQIQDGLFYIVKSTGATTFDIGDSRVRLNPPSDWEETDTTHPSYIANKPDLGTVSSHDVATAIDQTQNIPTSSMVYDAVRAIDQRVANAMSMVGPPLVAKGIAEMVDTTKIYIYLGSETGMVNGDWYYYDGSLNEWVDGMAYTNAVIDTDKTLLIENKAADAKATGDAINQLQTDLREYDVHYTFSIDENGHLIEIAERYDDISFYLEEGRMMVAYG